MAVYVDNARLPFKHRGRTLLMCHMIADTRAELLAMIHVIGLEGIAPIQKAGTAEEHFDVALRYRQRAIDRGAIEINSRQLVRHIQAKRR